MEFTMKTIVVLFLTLVVVLVCATIILGWSTEANGLVGVVIKPFQGLFT
jgi:hypothetical protein